MSLIQGLIGARINETVDNYARADRLLNVKLLADTNVPSGTLAYDSDSSFWSAMLNAPQTYVNKRFVFRDLILSEWVPRVPGLAHKPVSANLLRLTMQDASGSPRNPLVLDGFKVYQPEEKSLHVMSGVGTLRLPPNTDGEWLLSGSSNGDASLGVPVLVTADVWDRIQQGGSCEGRMISGNARWQPMAMEWSKHFRSTGDIPPGYFVLNDPDAIAVDNGVCRTWVFPFTIMEYESGANELFDYVYCGAHTDGGNFRGGIEDFFESYRLRYGGARSRFLIAADLVRGLWPADFNSPADLLAEDASARSQLDLLRERVNERMLGQSVINELLAKMDRVLSEDDLVRLSSEVGIGPRTWQRTTTTLAEQCSQFLAAVVAEKKQDALLERLAAQTPAIFN